MIAQQDQVVRSAGEVKQEMAGVSRAAPVQSRPEPTAQRGSRSAERALASRPPSQARSAPPAPSSSRSSTPLRWQDRAAALPRAQIEDVLTASKHLSPGERALIDGVYRRGLSVTALAAITGERPHRLRRRLRDIVQRMRSPLFRYVLHMLAMRDLAGERPSHCRPDAAAANRSSDLSSEQRLGVARAIVLQRRSQRAAARDLNLSLHRVRREIDRLRALADDAARHRN
jgi:DNA-directed RNA polymerase specialized sigma24 family protein